MVDKEECAWTSIMSLHDRFYEKGKQRTKKENRNTRQEPGGLDTLSSTRKILKMHVSIHSTAGKS